MQLAISNRQAKAKIRNFKTILSNLITNEKSGYETISFSTIFINSITLLGLAKSNCKTI